MADSYAKWATEAHHDPVGREHLRGAGFVYLTRKTTEARLLRTKVDPRPCEGQPEIPPPPSVARSARTYGENGGKLRVGITSSFPAMPHSDPTWQRRSRSSSRASVGCESRERQSRFRLFFGSTQSRGMWGDVGKACKWKHLRVPTRQTTLQRRQSDPGGLNLPAGHEPFLLFSF